MENTKQKKEFKDIFQNSLRLNARSMSVKTILSDRNLRRIDYSPYYQRNYVWDNSKQTFFIESVILGTEIPPLILFKSGNKIEVIDGRQRFETLKKFKENNISLRIKGLMELQILKNKSFNKLTDDIKDVFLDSNIRVFEFEIINQPDLSQETIDKIKKEIFRRYNTGITPLNREELDNAKYDEDDFSDLFKEKLSIDYKFLSRFNKCFFPKEKVLDKGKNDGLITKNVDFIRRYRILNSFPISTYAAGNRTEIIDLLYDFAKNDVCEEDEFEKFFDILNQVLNIYDELSKAPKLNNKLIYECILWAITILDQESIDVEIDLNDLQIHLLNQIDNYSEDSYHHYGNIIARFSDIASFFSKVSNCNYSKYIRNDKFKGKISELRQTEVDAAKSIEELSNLRLNKPNPISTPIDEIKHDLKTNRYLVRPSYQRQEKINIQKASSIIESIILGINLPPIFLFKKLNNVKEVVDGQQRLLAIIGFLGEQYYNEDGELKYSKNNNFKLTGLKILTDLEGSNYSALSDFQKDKILDFVIDLIIIEESVNDKFNPIDLFIRLNYKPYPIKSNSFEMWNSIVNCEITKKIKDICKDEEKNNWFFLRETKEGQPDRMLNEEMITILSFICYANASSLKVDDVIGFFPRQDRITCRLKNKTALSEFLTNEIDTNEKSKLRYLESIDRTEELITKFGELFGDTPSKEALNKVLNVKISKTFRRSLQDFYVIWLIIVKISNNDFDKLSDNILKDIITILSFLKNASDNNVDESYYKEFNKKLTELIDKYDNQTKQAFESCEPIIGSSGNRVGEFTH